jgi:hypothetical protein
MKKHRTQTAAQMGTFGKIQGVKVHLGMGRLDPVPVLTVMIMGDIYDKMEDI